MQKRRVVHISTKMIHLNATIISRGGEKPQSAVASAAYRSGTKIYCEYDGEIKDFSRKGHVIYSEILLPEFMQLGLVEVLEDNTYYMPEIQEMTGKGSSDGERKARYRRQKAESTTPLLADKNTGMGQNWDNVPPLSQFCPPEIRDKSIENRTYIKESEREKDTHSQTGQDKGINLYGRYENVCLMDKEMETLKSDFPADYQSMIEHLSEYMAYTGKTYKNHLATMECWKKADMKKEQEKGKGIPIMAVLRWEKAYD